MESEKAADILTRTFTKMSISDAEGSINSNMIAKMFSLLNPRDKQFIHQVIGLASITDRYNSSFDLDKVLNVIDLAKVYARVDELETANDNESLQYEDFLVKALLEYFRNDFFKWVNQPKCPKCGKDSNIQSIGVQRPPARNPDEISRVEVYKCATCNETVQFPRYNSATKLLDTREGRCGEWVNCFMLILKALLGTDAKIRYVWNYEDHVWCEYYSPGLQRWIHLDPCETAYDNPSLYSQNWGKNMSFVIGIGDGYMIDLSVKYVTDKKKQIDKASIISNPKVLDNFIRMINKQKYLSYYTNYLSNMGVDGDDKMQKLYNDVIVLRNQEILSLKGEIVPASAKDVPRGRQSGGKEWTKARGENGD